MVTTTLPRQRGFFPIITLTLLAIFVMAEAGGKQALLLLVGAGLGIALFAGSFGFAGSWRAFFVGRNATGIRAQFLVIAATAALFIPLMGLFPEQFGPAAAPIGFSLIIGAILFSLGMQLANGCASGTLFATGGGSIRSSLALIGFVAGAFWASLDMGFFLSLPAFEPILIADITGWLPSLVISLALALSAYGLFTKFDQSRTPLMPRAPRHWVGQWGWMEAGILLVLLNLFTLLIAGHPWSVTYGFTLWGAKIASALGMDLSNVAFWTWTRGSFALSNSSFLDTTSVMNIGLILGASIFAIRSGRSMNGQTPPAMQLVAAIIGGLLMGYGARLSFGCNIGTFLAGTASGSLHGWVWFLVAFAVTPLGLRLRQIFGMGN